MNPPESITCRPTPWFLLRALAMLLMFGVFAVLFYIDGSTGYRSKNEGYYLHQTFRKASEDFGKMEADGGLTAEQWSAYASAQKVDLPEDHTVLPADLDPEMAWPAVLQDYEQMKSLEWKPLWRNYSGQRKLNETPPDEPFDARKIFEQWVVFWICLALGLIAGFVLVRTLRRSIIADAAGVTTQTGRRIPYSEMKVLDLRKWDTKGLAFVDYDGPSGKGRARIDGLTYGGFKKENDEPAEQLMSLLRSRFSGEIIEYAPIVEEEVPDPGSNPA